ncbi:hypothetical protein KUV95_16600, partial [Microbulbifer agarilyticus]|uniref:hypothetical protein n=1 Tax=Microbulbifer agarilyticus TaxID=260552 RepID=UPI001C94B9F8
DPEKDAHYMAPISFGKLFFRAFFSAGNRQINDLVFSTGGLPRAPSKPQQKHRLNRRDSVEVARIIATVSTLASAF